MIKRIFLYRCTLLVLLFPLFVKGKTNPPVLTVEYQALVDFYNATNSTSWINKWDVRTNNLHEVVWYGVTVEGSHIVGLNLNNNNVKGSIPASFSNLKYLRTLNLAGYYNNDFSTADLNNLSGLESLEDLDMSFCYLKGSIPVGWSKLIKLKNLALRQNAFEGPIFNEIGELKDLENINLSGNSFTSVPATISNLTKLKTLNLASNKITTLIKETELLTNLTSLDISYNQLLTIQALLMKSVGLNLRNQLIYMNEMIYKGEDVIIKDVPQITRYNRDKNDFSELNNFRLYVRGADMGVDIKMKADGSLTIPKQYLTSLRKADDIYLYQNNGSAYYSIIHFKKVTIDLPAVSDAEYKALVDFYNATNGTSWSNKWNISVNDLNEGAWYGLSIEGGHVVSMDLNNNYVKGFIPSSFNNLKYLRSLNLSGYYNNDLNATDLNNISGLDSLENLNLYFCYIKGSIPSSWSNLKKLKTLYLHHNNLEGPIPHIIGELTNLETANFAENQFTSIPATISNLKKLKVLSLANNKIAILIKETELLTSLTNLDVSYNQLLTIQALLPKSVGLNLRSQTIYMDELIYKGEDVLLKNLPNIIRYNRNKNDFSELNNFKLYVRGADAGVNIQVKADSSLIIPKQYLTSLKKTDDIYLYQSNGSAYYSTIHFKKVIIELPAVPDKEYKALVDFYNATNGASWSNKWNVNVNNLNEGAWYGLSIEGGHIVGMNLNNNYVKGAIPASFNNLKYLRSLDLGGSYSNDLSTTDLNNISGLDSLENLNLYFCYLKGSIPSSWSNLKKLKTLYLHRNNLEGPIHDGIGELTNLETANFSENQFTSIPITIRDLKKLKVLNLASNKITTLIKETELLPSLNSLDINYNQVSDIQALIPKAVSLTLRSQTIYMDELVYKGEDVILKDLPNTIHYNRDKNDFSELNNFKLYVRGADMGVNIPVRSDNSLIIPKQYIGSLKKGDDIYLYQTNGSAYYSTIHFKKITFDMPAIPDAEYKALVDLYNATSGSNWYNKWNVSVNNLHEGAWYGLSIESGHIVGMDLNNNNVKGTLPTTFTNLKYLRSLNLSGYTSNDFSAADLNVLSGLDSLEILNFYYCSLKGEIPSGWSNLKKLKQLNLRNNNISNLSPDISSLKLTDLNLNSQSITMDSILVESNEINITLPLIMVVALNNKLITFDAKNDFRLYVNGAQAKTAVSNNGKLTFTDMNLLNLKITDKLSIYQVNGIGAYSTISYSRLSFGKPLAEAEFNILKKFYSATNGASWTKKWDITQNNLNAINLVGVQIKDGHVISLNLFNNNLSGTLPEEITGLKFLKTLNLSNNQVSGGLPKDIPSLADLEVLDLSSNLLSGSIPLKISDLKKLKKFAIGNNTFAGALPSTLSDFTALEYLDLSSNSFDTIEKKLYYDFSKTFIDLRNQKINYNTVLRVDGNQLKVNLSDIVKYDLEKNNYEARNKFALLVNTSMHTTTVTNASGEIVFDSIRIGAIPANVKIVIRQLTGTFSNTEFTYAGIEDKSNIQVAESEYATLVKFYNQLNGSRWINKWDVSANNLHIKKWFGVSTYDGHIVSLNLSSNNVSGVIPNLFDKFPFLNSVNLSVNKLTGVESVLPSGVDLIYDRQMITTGEIALMNSTVIHDLNINRYEHSKKGFYNQTYDLRVGSFSKTVNVTDAGIKLMDIMTLWNIPNNQEIELRQISGDARNSIISFNLKYKMGDANMDDKINVLDIQTTINYIFNNTINYFNYGAADVNSDSKISVLDVVGIVKLIQDQPPGKPSDPGFLTADQVKAKLSIENGHLLLDPNGYEVSGLEIRLNNSAKESVQELISSLGFNVSISEKDNQLCIVAYSFDHTLKDKIALAELKQSTASIFSVLLSSPEATEIPCEIGSIILGITDQAAASVANNHPNPFSCETTIEIWTARPERNAVLFVYDLQAKKIEERPLGNLIKGLNTYKFQSPNLLPGTYLYLIRTADGTILKGKMNIQK